MHDFRRVVDSRFGLGRTGLTGRGPDSPAICPDTPGSWGLGIPGMVPDSPDSGVRILRVYARILRIFGLELCTGRTGLTGWVYRSDRYSRAEKGSIRVSWYNWLEIILAISYI